jgi:hypothetical protein
VRVVLFAILPVAELVKRNLVEGMFYLEFFIKMQDEKNIQMAAL